MSTTTERRPYTAAAPIAELGARLNLHWKHVVACAWFGGLFLYLNYIPLFHSDIWGHLHLGQWILEHRALPTEDPFLPLAEGMLMIDTAWLSQVLFALAEQWGGSEGMSTMFAAMVVATYCVLARVFYLQSGRLSLALTGTLLVLLFGWTRHAIIRPEIFGGFCFATLLWLITAEARFVQSPGNAATSLRPSSVKASLRLWLGIPALFLVWANLHGTYAVGLVVLGCVSAGNIVEVAWRSRSLRAPLEDAEARRWLLLTELALAACLINPYGMELLVETVRFGRNPNLRDVLEWFPLKLIDFEGWQFCLAWTLVMVVFRHSRRTIAPAEILLLAVLGASVAPTVRMIGWFAPVVIWVLMPHVADLVARRSRSGKPRLSEPSTDPQRAGVRSVSLALACLLVLWISFAMSPSSAPMLGGKPRPSAQLYSRATPLELTDYLRNNTPAGLVWAPQWWGDWLAWAGPPGIQVFMTTDLHLAPQRVWQDYLRIAQAQTGWERLLDRYQVNTLVLHKELQAPLVTQARKARGWNVAYEDRLGVVFSRAKPGDATSTVTITAHE